MAVVSFRISEEELAKALDGLQSTGDDFIQFNNISQIVRTTFYYGIIHLCNNPKEPPSRESINKISQLKNQNKIKKPVNIKDLLKGKVK